jgi:hypothetical protein
LRGDAFLPVGCNVFERYFVRLYWVLRHKKRMVAELAAFIDSFSLLLKVPTLTPKTGEMKNLTDYNHRL